MKTHHIYWNATEKIKCYKHNGMLKDLSGFQETPFTDWGIY